jgi:nicotinate-nucleotide adenylyltransferase
MALLGIFGGTFDPIHNGHLRCAWELSEQLEMPIRMIPSCQPVHREQPGAAAEHRLAMLELALAGQDRLVADARELERGGDSYMVDTLESVHTDYPDQTTCLILGMDAFKAIETWYCWQKLFELTHIIVVGRPGEDDRLSDSLALWVEDRRVSDRLGLASANAGKVLNVDVSKLQISASGIRAQIAGGQKPRYLLPVAVMQYIATHQLYS